MNAEPSRAGGMRRSQRIALVLLGTTGVVGVATLWNAIRESRQGADSTVAPSPGVPPAMDQEYANNSYLPGVGYYHAGYHGWFPHPYNYYDPARGYYAGGFWQAVPWAVALMQSRPSQQGAALALAAQRERQRQQAAPPWTVGSSGGARGTTVWSGGRPISAPSSSHTPVIRGGFGSSAHPAGS